MRAFIAGNGSMGKRRERDLRSLGVDATAYDAWPQDRGLTPEQHEAWKSADVVVLSTPPLTKHRATYWASEEGKPCFTEADVAFTRFAHFPSCTPLFTDWFPVLEHNIDVHASTSYILHVGQHIDDWHPGTDKATYYAYQDATGPTREMVPFELIWLSKLFGPVEKATGQRSPELAAVRVEHARGVVGRIIIDAVSRPPIRSFEIFGACNLRFALTYSEDTYRREMRAFVESVEGGKPWPYSLAEERANLEVLRTIERA